LVRQGETAYRSLAQAMYDRKPEPVPASGGLVVVSGTAFVNDVALTTSAVIRSGQKLVSGPASVAEINTRDSLALLGADSAATLAANSVELDSGSVVVFTASGLSVKSGGLTIAPGRNGTASYEVTCVNTFLTIRARRGDLAVSDGARVREGEVAFRSLYGRKPDAPPAQGGLLLASGMVTVNGRPSAAVAVMADDSRTFSGKAWLGSGRVVADGARLLTGAGSVAGLETKDSVFLIGPRSSGVLGANSVTLDAGSVAVFTTVGASVRAGDMVVTPASASSTYEVIAADNSATVVTRKGDLRLSNGKKIRRGTSWMYSFPSRSADPSLVLYAGPPSPFGVPPAAAKAIGPIPRDKRYFLPQDNAAEHFYF
jgi:hypothetical protein